MANLNISAAKTSTETTVSAKRGTATATADKIALGRATDSIGGDLLNAIEKGGVVTVGTTTTPPSDATSWIHIRTDINAIEFKQRTGAEGAYQYAVSRRVFMGDSKAEIIYHSGASPPAPSVSWDSNNNNFNVTGGGWGLMPSNARWFRIITLKGDSANTVQISPQIPVGDISAENVTYTNSAHSAINNVKEGLDTALARPEQVISKDVSLIQTDDYTNVTYGQQPPFLDAPGSNGYASFTVKQSLQDYVRTFQEHIFIEAYARIELQASVAPPSSPTTYRFSITDSTGVALSPPISGTVSIQQSNNPVTGVIRIAGNLPLTVFSGRLNVAVAGGPNAIAGITQFKLQIRPSITADETVIAAADVSGNLHKSSNPVTDLDDVIREIDILPIQYALYGTQSNFTVTAGTTHTFDMPIPEQIQRINQKNGHQYRLRITFEALVVANSGLGGPRQSQAAWTFKLTKNDTTTDLLSQAFSRNDASSLGTVRHTRLVTLASDATKIVAAFEIADTNDADINITSLEYDYEEPRAVSTISGDNVTIDASGFDGNLATTDTTAQLVAQKVDDLVLGGTPSASQVTVDNAEFSSPDNFIGGIRQPLPSGVATTDLVNNPANAQEAFVKTDYLLQNAYNPYQLTQKLDWNNNGVISESFNLSASTAIINSSRIDVPDEILRLQDVSGIIVRTYVRIASMSGTFMGTIQLRNSGAAIDGIDDYTVDGSTSAHSSGNFISFQRVIPESLLSTLNLTVRFNRSAGTAIYNLGFVYIEDTGVSGAGARGQTSGFTTTDIWAAGPNAADRLTAAGSTQTLDTGFTWSQFDAIATNYDTASGAGLVKQIWTLRDDFVAADDYGVISHTDLYAYLIRPVGTTDNQFQMIWNGGGALGIRKIIGINF